MVSPLLSTHGTGFVLQCLRALPVETLKVVGVVGGVSPWDAKMAKPTPYDETVRPKFEPLRGKKKGEEGVNRST
jgi:hypothetical protein